jgi:hypothetical protein
MDVTDGSGDRIGFYRVAESLPPATSSDPNGYRYHSNTGVPFPSRRLT